MRAKHVIKLLILSLLVGQASADVGTAFTYQGQLEQGGQVYNGAADLTFRMYDALSGGVQVGATLEAPATPIAQGRFTIDLDFGPGQFDGGQRWLEVEVNDVVLAPRQPIMPVPYAVYAATGPGLGAGGASWSFRDELISTTASVGIGTSSPSSPLHVAGTARANSWAAYNPNNETAAVTLSWFDDVARLRVGGNGAGQQNGLDFQTLGNSSMMRIVPPGNVGIGTTSPDGRLHLSGTNLVELIVEADVNDTGAVSDNARIRLRQDGGQVTARMGFGSNNDLEIMQEFADDLTLGANDVRHIYVKPDGRIGIGVSDPASRLHVDGSIRSTGADGGVVLAYNPDNQNAAVQMSWANDVARIRVGGSGPGSQNGIDFQRQGNASMMRLFSDGRVRIGSIDPPPGTRLAVDGKVLCEEVEVMLSQDWPDYVFEDDYELTPLDELAQIVREQKHLPDIPAAAEVEVSGVGLGDMQARLLRKVEELTLYLIDLDREVTTLQDENAELLGRIASLEATGEPAPGSVK